MIKYKIKNNFLPDDEFKKLFVLLNSPDFPWYFHNTTTTGDSHPYFCHGLYNFDVPKSSFYREVAGPIITKIPMYSLLRCKGNLYSKTGQPTASDKHVDMEFPHTTAIFFINTNNGFTVLSGDEEVKVESVENRLLTFDGLTPHYFITQTDSPVRINININYLYESKI